VLYSEPGGWRSEIFGEGLILSLRETEVVPTADRAWLFLGEAAPVTAKNTPPRPKFEIASPYPFALPRRSNSNRQQARWWTGSTFMGKFTLEPLFPGVN
jgi:hypothetical protein